MIDFSTEAEDVFEDPDLLLMPDTDHSRLEVRYNALGVTAARRRLHVTFTLRDLWYSHPRHIRPRNEP